MSEKMEITEGQEPILVTESSQPLTDQNEQINHGDPEKETPTSTEVPTVDEVMTPIKPEDNKSQIPENISDPEHISSPKSTFNVKQEPEVTSPANALSLLTQYSSSEEYEEETYRKPASSSSSSSSSSSDSDDAIEIKEIVKKIREPVESDEDSDDGAENNKKKKKEPLKVKGEMSLDDLPPIEDLQISVDETECLEIGTVTSIVDKLALVEALANSVPLDIDSVLFLDKGKQALGKVFDVIGPVAKPIYCVRFNTHEEIATKGIQVGTKIFHAPRTEYTSYVILSQVMTKGSDASWKFDIEPPENLVDYSDDEQERRTKKKKKANRQQNSAPGERREFVRGRRFLPGQQYPDHQQQNFHQQNFNRPNFPQQNYSWHQNFQQPPPPQQNNFHGFNSQYYY